MIDRSTIPTLLLPAEPLLASDLHQVPTEGSLYPILDMFEALTGMANAEILTNGLRTGPPLPYLSVN